MDDTAGYLLRTQREEYEDRITRLEQQLRDTERDIQAYRGALGYSVLGDHDGKLTDGTTPVCGLCNAKDRRIAELEHDLEIACAKMDLPPLLQMLTSKIVDMPFDPELVEKLQGRIAELEKELAERARKALESK